MRLDVRTILVLWHPDGRRVLLLRRSESKKLFPGLMTGIGGAVELGRGEGEDLEGAVLRELEEETRIRREEITRPRLRLSTMLSRGEEQVVLLWFTARLLKVPEDLACEEGVLRFYHAKDLPLEAMVPTARDAIAFVTSLAEDDPVTYSGVYQGETMRLITNQTC